MAADDFGDAPNPYPTLIADNGASHSDTGPTLGASRDTETNGLPTGDLDGDDTTGADDEDGVTFLSTLQLSQLDACVNVIVSNAPGGAKLDAWVDFNDDGAWGGPFERIANDIAVSNGDNVIKFDVPSWAVDADVATRFRLSTAGNIAQSGAVADGEVEDHKVTINPPTCIPSLSWTPRVITTAADGTESVFAADVDGDGDMDVLSANNNKLDNKITWYENDGSQNFTTHIISSAAKQAQSIMAVDMDGDGDMDALSASRADDKIAWYENDGNENFTTHNISLVADNAQSAYAADVDQDGDMDVLSV